MHIGTALFVIAIIGFMILSRGFRAVVFIIVGIIIGLYGLYNYKASLADAREHDRQMAEDCTPGPDGHVYLPPDMGPNWQEECAEWRLKHLNFCDNPSAFDGGYRGHFYYKSSKEICDQQRASAVKPSGGQQIPH
jgi:hypothetical protein